MTKYRIYIFSAAILMVPTLAMAEDTAVVTDAAVTQAEKTAEEVAAPLIAPESNPAPDQLIPAEPSLPLEAPELPTSLDAAVAPAAPIDTVPVPEAPVVIAEAIPTDNLEFISGEISSTDETTQSVTVKLYGEAESGTSDKTLKVTVDGTTDITDGEQDRDLKSLTAGTEVDVEYDPATNKATYIFVY
jgi:hypothetical protein